MFTILRLGLLSLLLFPASPLRAENASAPEAPPTTPEEIQKAAQELSRLFSHFAGPIPVPVKPEWFPLNPEDAKRVEEVLTAWSASRAKGGRLRCQFRKWEFDPDFGPKDPAVPFIYTTGEFRWGGPDVWMWKGTSAKKAVVKGDKTEWVNVDPYYWARNKDTFYEWDYRRKTRTEHRYPVDSVGQPQIRILGFFVATFPLTDIYRLDPAGLQDRFWIRPLTPTEGKCERWLELVPRKDADAKQFSSLLVAISESDWDIRALDIRASNYSAESYSARTSLEFLKRTRPTAMTGFLNDCLSPAGWKSVIADYRDMPSKK